jgi:hypothetical protein
VTAIRPSMGTTASTHAGTPPTAQAGIRPRDRAETMCQAHTWDKVATRYRRAGFCDHCAAQAAWGHQLGFTSVQPVGDCCRGREVPAEHNGRFTRRWVNGGDAG